MKALYLKSNFNVLKEERLRLLQEANEHLEALDEKLWRIARNYGRGLLTLEEAIRQKDFYLGKYYDTVKVLEDNDFKQYQIRECSFKVEFTE